MFGAAIPRPSTTMTLLEVALLLFHMEESKEKLRSSIPLLSWSEVVKA
jgi:hypothetical protein